MKKTITYYFLFFSSIFGNFSHAQHYFNVVLPSYRDFVEGIEHPLIELSKDSLVGFTTTTYLRNFGGTGRFSILDRKGNLYYTSTFLDSINTNIIFDSKLLDNNILISGTKLILKDTAQIFWYSKLNNKLDTIWSKEVKTGYNRCYLRRLIQINRNGIAFCGTNDQTRPNSSASLTSHGVVIITDSLGEMQHFIEVNDLDTTTLEGYYGMNADKDGNIYACGIVKKSGFNHDAVIVKVSSNGKLIWRKQIPSPDYLEGVFNAFVQDDNSILFIGDSYNPDFFGDKFSVVLLINMSPNGLINWTKRIMKIYDGEIRYCVEDPSNNYICSGTYFSEAGKKGDGYLVKFSAKGDSIWSKIINKSDRSTEQFFNISKASDGGFYLTGFSWIDSINTSKSWIVKVDSFGCLVPGCQNVVNTNDISKRKVAAFKFFPNPARDVFYFLSRITESNNYQIKVIDLRGREVFKYSFQPVSGKQYVVEIPEKQPSGIYTLGVFDEKGRMVQVEKMELH